MTETVRSANGTRLRILLSSRSFFRAGYRIEGPGRYKTMTLKPDEFIRRLLMHVLPNGFPPDKATAVC